MDVIYLNSFGIDLEKQVDYIARDKPLAALKFADDIVAHIEDSLKSPFICRKSIHFDDPNIRDVIFKGYTVTFKIIKALNKIEVFSLIGWQK